jgi:hypothetical protein
VFVLVAGLFALLCALWSLAATARGSNWLNAAGATMAGGAALITALAYIFVQASPRAVGYSHGPGPYVAAAAGALILAGAWFWAWQSPVAELRPVPEGIGWGRLMGGLAAIALVVISVYSGWSFDERAETVITPEIQAELDEVRRRADAGEIPANIAAQEIQRINNTAVAAQVIVVDGYSDGGPRLALPPLALVLLGACTLGLASGLSRSRMRGAVDRFRNAESASGRESMMALGLISGLTALLWVYPVDRLAPFLLDFRTPALYRPVGGLGDAFGDWEWKYLGGEWLEALFFLVVAAVAVRWAVRAEEMQVKATRMAAIGFIGVAALVGVVAWRHGGLAALYLVAAAALPLLVGAFAPTMSSRHQWTWATLTGAIGVGLMALSAGWVFSVLRVANAKFFSGIGAMLAFAAGFILFVSARGILGYFGRQKVYGDIADRSQSAAESDTKPTDAAVLEPAEALAGS